MKKRKIVFISYSLPGGGVERILLGILKYLDREKFTPLLVLLNKRGVFLDEISKYVEIIDLQKKNKLSFFRLIIDLAFNIYPKIKPDIVFSFLEYCNFINVLAGMLNFRLKKKIILNVQNYTTSYLNYSKFILAKKLLLKLLYPKADIITVSSEGVRSNLINDFKIKPGKIKVIYNFVDIPLVERLSTDFVDDVDFKKCPVIIACGRLVHQKNYPLLLNAFSIVLKKIDAKLFILGDGEERDEIIDLSNKIGVKDRVNFLGFKKNPFKYISKSDVFVLSSIYEGFANVIVEAMACGIPVVSTNCPSGPDEIITDGINGILVPVGDENAMSDAIIKILTDKDYAKSIADNGRKRAQDFITENKVREYEKLFSQNY